MGEVGTIMLVLVVGLLVAWLGNSLPPVRAFPGRNWVIVRSLVWLTLILAAQQGFEKDLPKSADTVLRYVTAGACVALLYEGYLLWSGMQQASARSQTNQPTSEATQPGQGKAEELRQKLLKEMRRRVRQRLDYAFGEQALINLPMVPQPEAVAGGRRQGNVFLVPQSVPQPMQRLEKFGRSGRRAEFRAVPSEETILDTFEDEDIDGQLLILGAPGSGKTTALLKLAEALLEQAKGNNQIPYIFELSAWTDTRQDIASWMMAQLKFDYGIDEQVSRQWILGDGLDGQLLPLLDGLDELAPVAQQRCVEKINEFVNGNLGRRLVVCCRSKEYKDGALMLDSLNGALCLQPLEETQVRQYFAAIERPEIWAALQNEDGLGALMLPPKADKTETAPAKIPLFLQMITVAYEGKAGKEIATKSELFEAYIAQRLSVESRRWDRQRARKKKSDIKWAYKTVENEPDVERTKRYLSWLARKLNENSIPNVFLIERMQPSWLDTRAEEWQHCLIVCLLGGLILSLIFSLIFSLLGGLISSLIGGLIFGLILGLISGLIGGLIFGLLDGDKIYTVETFKFSLSRFAQKEFRYGLIISLIISLISGLILSLIGLTSGLIGLTSGLMVSLIVGLVFGLIFGLKEDFQTREVPNQGIVASAKNLLIIIPLLCPAGFLINFLLDWLMEDEIIVQENLLLGLFFAVLLGFYLGGGIPVVQHIILRSMLHHRGKAPHNYAKFLRYTTERRLTQQVGGSFRFIHRELLDRFAEMSVGTSQKTR